MRTVLPAIFLTLACAAIAQDLSPAQAEILARGDAAWARRAEGFAERGRPDREPAAEAVAAYRQAHAENPQDLDARFKLIEALWFQGHFIVTDKTEAKRLFGEMTDLTEETVALVEAPAGKSRDLGKLAPAEHAKLLAALPRAADAHFWAAISWGLWAMSHGNAAAGFKGVAGKIRAHAEVLIALDERFANAGGLRLLGRLHAATPRVPLFTGWVDGKTGIALLEHANAVSSSDPRNPLFLAQALLDHAPARREEALALLREVAARAPDPAFFVEQQETLDEARRVLAEQETGHEHR